MSAAPRTSPTGDPRGDAARAQVLGLNGNEPKAIEAPHSPEAEAACIAFALLDAPASLAEILDVLRSPECFHVHPHQVVWRVVLDLVEQKRVVDVVTVSTELRKSGMRAAIGGQPAIARMASYPNSITRPAKYAQIVLEFWHLRQLADTCKLLAAEAFSGNVGAIPEYLAEAARKVADVGESPAQASVEDLRSVGQVAFEELHEQWAGKRDPWGLRGKFKRLHALTHGHGMGQVTVVTGVTGGGKSCYSLEEAICVAGSTYGTREQSDGSRVPERVGAGVIALELPKKQVYRRALVQRTHMLGAEVGVEGWLLKELLTGRDARSGELIAETDAQRHWILEEARRQLDALPIEIDDRSVDVLGIRTTALRMAARLRARGARLRFLVIDHLHLVRFPRATRMREDEVIADAVRELKSLSVELELHVMVLAQYKREATEEMRKQGRAPVITDIKAASAIEQIADKIVMLHVPAKLMDRKVLAAIEDPEKRKAIQRKAMAIVGKHRDGAEGEVEMEFLGERFSFFEGGSDE